MIGELDECLNWGIADRPSNFELAVREFERAAFNEARIGKGRSRSWLYGRKFGWEFLFFAVINGNSHRMFWGFKPFNSSIERESYAVWYPTSEIECKGQIAKIPSGQEFDLGEDPTNFLK